MADDAGVPTTEEATDLLRVSTKAILALARDSSPLATKVGRAWRFLRKDVADHVRLGQADRQPQVAVS